MWPLEGLLKLGGADRYTMLAECLTHDRLLVILYVISNTATYLACGFIGWTLLRRIKQSPGNIVSFAFSVQAAGLYGATFFFIGVSSLTEVFTLRWGIYRFDAIVSGLAATLAVVTAWITTHEMSGQAAKRVGSVEP